MKKGIGIIIAVLIVMMALITGCSKYQRDIYNDSKKIAAEGDSYSYRSRIGNTYNDKTKIKFSKFYGMDTIWLIEAKEESTISIDVNADISSGKFKVVSISPEKEVRTLFEGSKTEKIEVKVQKGKSRIKIVGDEAKGEINMTIKGNDNLKVKKAW